MQDPEFKSLDKQKQLTELASDKDSLSTEFTAVLKYAVRVMRTTATTMLLPALVCPSGMFNPSQGIKSKIIPVQNIVQMVGEMAGKVQKELDETTADLQEYAKFSDNEVIAKDYAIED